MLIFPSLQREIQTEVIKCIIIYCMSKNPYSDLEKKSVHFLIIWDLPFLVS